MPGGCRTRSPDSITIGLDSSDPAKLKEVVAGGGILLSEGEVERSLKQALAHSLATPVRLAIGPEGGWTAEEQAAFESAGWQSASLGATSSSRSSSPRSATRGARAG